MWERVGSWRWTRLTAFLLVVLAAGFMGFAIKGLLFGSPSSLPPVAVTDDFDSGMAVAPTDEFDPLEPTPEPTVAVAGSEAPATVVVYISGAVAMPDTYEVAADARVSDVVQLAGGLTAEADRDKINLSERIHDAQHIHIVRVGQDNASVASEPSGNNPSDGRINLNTASVSELDSLPRIGKVLAQRIVDWRTTNGPFASTDDVKQVTGVTASIYEEIKEQITVE